MQKQELVRCDGCDAPVIKSVGSCNTCKAVLNGSEVGYIAFNAEVVTVKPLLIQLLAIWLAVFVLTGFDPNAWLMTALIVVSGFYVLKMFKRWE